MCWEDLLNFVSIYDLKMRTGACIGGKGVGGIFLGYEAKDEKFFLYDIVE